MIDSSHRVILLFASILGGGCCFPIPHATQEYSSDAPFPIVSAPVMTAEIERYFVGGSFIKARFIDDDVNNRGDPLFHFLVGIEQGKQRVERVLLHGLALSIDGSEFVEVEIKDSSEANRAHLPLTKPFLVSPRIRGDKSNYYFFSETIEAAESDFQSATLTIDIQVETSEGSERKVVVHEVQRKVTNRMLLCAEV